MYPRFVDVTNHQVHFAGDRYVAADAVLASVDRLKRRCYPVIPCSSRVRIGKDLQNCQSRRAEQVRRNFISRERLTGERIMWQGIGQSAAEIAELFRCCRNFAAED